MFSRIRKLDGTKHWFAFPSWLSRLTVSDTLISLGGNSNYFLADVLSAAAHFFLSMVYDNGLCQWFMSSIIICIFRLIIPKAFEDLSLIGMYTVCVLVCYAYFLYMVNSFKPDVLFVGHRQTV